MDKLKKNSTIAHTEVLSESQFFGDTDVVPTDVPMINVALSGNTEGGITRLPYRPCRHLVNILKHLLH